MIELLKRNADLFARDSYDVGRTTLLHAEINTGNHAPISEPLRRHAKVHLDLIDKTVEDLQAAGLVEESTSAWASNLVIVNHEGGPPRVTVDLRRLNSITCCLLYTSPSPRDGLLSRMPSSA